jgi:hypothetical protein
MSLAIQGNRGMFYIATIEGKAVVQKLEDGSLITFRP